MPARIAARALHDLHRAMDRTLVELLQFDRHLGGALGEIAACAARAPQAETNAWQNPIRRPRVPTWRHRSASAPWRGACRPATDDTACPAGSSAAPADIRSGHRRRRRRYRRRWRVRCRRQDNSRAPARPPALPDPRSRTSLRRRAATIGPVPPPSDRADRPNCSTTDRSPRKSTDRRRAGSRSRCRNRDRPPPAPRTPRRAAGCSARCAFPAG